MMSDYQRLADDVLTSADDFNKDYLIYMTLDYQWITVYHLLLPLNFW